MDSYGWLSGALRCPACHAPLDVEATGLRCSAGHAWPLAGTTAVLLPSSVAASDAAQFYEDGEAQRLGRDEEAIDANSERWVREFVGRLGDVDVLLEIGAGRGAFDGIHPRHVALDISGPALRAYATSRTVQGDAANLPFRDGAVSAIFSVFALEHVPDPERALAEVHRVLAPGGEALLYPAWFVRRWASRGIEVRPRAELRPLERAERLTIPLRNTRAWRLARILPGRVLREAGLRRGARDLPLAYGRRQPNFDVYLGPDSDACNALDPEAVSSWFVSRGYEDLRREGLAARLLYGYEPVHVRKPA